MADHVGSINEGTLGSLDTNSLSDGEAGHVLADVAGRVGLDQEVEVARLVITADGSIGPDHLLGAAVGLRDSGTNGDVLADWKTEDGPGRGEVEAVDGDIVGNDRLFLELEFLELIGLEDLGRLCITSCLAVPSRNRRTVEGNSRILQNFTKPSVRARSTA